MGTAGEQLAVNVSTLRAGAPLRRTGIDEAHVRRLLATVEDWPPLVISTSRRVVDGQHRLEAAHRLGLETVQAIVIEVSDDDLQGESYARNSGHGLALSQADRRSWVRYELGRHPEWSDRRLARNCGVSPGVVSRLRAARSTATSAHSNGGESGADEQLDIRTGLDGRQRIVGHDARRATALELLRTDPACGVRELHRRTGVSLGTASALKRQSGADPREAVRPNLLEILGRVWRRIRGCVERFWRSKGRAAQSRLH